MSVRPDWTVIWNGGTFEALPLVQASIRLKAMRRKHAEQLAEKLNADAVTLDVAEKFWPGEVVS
jgi:hypothetical protein